MILRKPPPPPARKNRGPKIIAVACLACAMSWAVEAYSESSTRRADEALIRAKADEVVDMAAAATAGVPVPEPLIQLLTTDARLVAEAASRQRSHLRGDCQRYVRTMRDLVAAVRSTSPERRRWAEETEQTLARIQDAAQ